MFQLNFCAGWGIFPVFQLFAPTRLLPITFRLGDFPDFPAFLPNQACFSMASGWGIFPVFPAFLPKQLASLRLPVGGFPRFPSFSPQTACFSMASGWGIFPVFQLFPQTSLLLYGFRLGDFPSFPTFPQPACFPGKKQKKTRRHKPTRFAGEKNWFINQSILISRYSRCLNNEFCYTCCVI